MVAICFRRRSIRRERSFSSCSTQLALALGRADLLLGLGHEAARALEQRRVGVAFLGQHPRATRGSQRLGVLAGLAELDRLAVGRLDRRARLLQALRAFAVDPPEAAAAEEQRQRDRAAQRDGQLARAAFLGGLDARLGRGELGLLRALLDRGQEGVQRLGHDRGVGRAQLARRHQAVQAELHQRRIRVAGLERSRAGLSLACAACARIDSPSSGS